MRLSGRTRIALAEMICGASGGGGSFEWSNFPYRTSSQLTEFFSKCDLDYTHDGSTRKYWVLKVVDELNQKPASRSALPSDALLRVIQELLDPIEFASEEGGREAALGDLNRALARDGLEAYFDGPWLCHVRSVAAGESSAGIPRIDRALSAVEYEIKESLESYMDAATEDEFTEQVIVPLFRQLRFQRIEVAGHSDRALEFGKDLWMKYRLPSDHYLYFGAQVKREKLDARAGSLNRNIAAVLDQVRMALADPIWDPETNRRVLVDHVFVVSAGEITKAAKRLIAEKLDASMRRSILFLDREHLVELWLRVQLPVPGQTDQGEELDDLPF